jgi:hypothetical protein
MPQFSPVVAPELQTHMPLIVGEMSVTVRIASRLSPGPPDHTCADVPATLVISTPEERPSGEPGANASAARDSSAWS